MHVVSHYHLQRSQYERVRDRIVYEKKKNVIHTYLIPLNVTIHNKSHQDDDVQQ